MTDYIAKALAERPTGLALHYPLIHAAVVGMNARRTLEFGAGGSTRVFLEALPPDALHASISTESLREIAVRYQLPVAIGEGERAAFVNRHGCAPGPHWLHLGGMSSGFRDVNPGPLDLILHDGSHAADVVAADIAWAWRNLRRYGLLLVHDTMHSYCGAETRHGVLRGLAGYPGEYTATTLPFGFGLTVIRRECGGPDPIVPAKAKADSAHETELVEFRP